MGEQSQSNSILAHAESLELNDLKTEELEEGWSGSESASEELEPRRSCSSRVTVTNFSILLSFVAASLALLYLAFLRKLPKQSDDSLAQKETVDLRNTLVEREPHAYDILLGSTWGEGSCATYGCGVYQAGRNCQCNVECERYQSCCSDFATMCAGSCTRYGCSETYHHEHSCQCNSECEKYGSCCSDYTSTCANRPVFPTAAPTRAPVFANSSLNGIFGHPSASIDYPKYEGFTLMLAEEFDVPLDLDTDPIWTWSDGGLREGSVRFRKEAIKFEDGKMKIEVRKQHLPPLSSCSHASVEHIEYKPLMSGEMRSRYNLFRYGRYEVRMKAPEVKPGNPYVNGNFIATMFAYRDANAHHWREIDFEITGDRPNSLTTNLLYADGTKNWKPYLQDSRQPYLGDINVRKEFHTYMFEWTSNGVIWFVDGKEVRRGSKLKVPEKSAKIMMNLWIFTGGAFGGHEINNNQYPFHSEYDYFRFYKWDGDGHYPCANMDESCLTDDDLYLTGNNPCDGIPQQGLLEGKSPCTAQCTTSQVAHQVTQV